MADQRVNINIGSSYNGAGMSKALGAVNDMSRTAKKTAGAVGQLAGAFDGLGGSASKSIGAISGALGALATGGIFGAIIFGVTTLVSWFAKLGEQEKPIDKMKKALEGVSTSTEKLVTSTNVAISNIDKTTAAVDKLTAAQLRLANAEAKAKKNALDETIENLTSDGTDEGAARNIMTKAAAEKAKVQIDTSTAEEAANAIVNGVVRKINGLSDVAGEKRKDGTIAEMDGKIEVLRKTLRGYKDAKTGVDIEGLDDQMKALETEVAEANLLVYTRKERKADKDEVKEAEDQLKEASKALADFTHKTYYPTVRQLNDAQQELQVQEANLKAAEAERTNVLSDNSKKLKAADDAYIAATREAAHAREKTKIEEEQLIAKQLAHAANEQALDERQTELKQATEELALAEWQYAQRLKEARAATAGWRGEGGWGNNGAQVGAGQIIGNGINGANRYGARNNQSVNDSGYNARVEEGYERNARSQGYGLSAKEQREYNNLAEKMVNGGKNALTKSQQKRWEELKAKNPEDIAAAKEKEAEKAKDRVDELKTKIENLNTSVKNIETWLKNHDGAQ